MRVKVGQSPYISFPRWNTGIIVPVQAVEFLLHILAASVVHDGLPHRRHQTMSSVARA